MFLVWRGVELSTMESSLHVVKFQIRNRDFWIAKILEIKSVIRGAEKVSCYDTALYYGLGM